jgi:hypothetical protein
MDSHRLTFEVVQLVRDLPKRKLQKFDKPLELHVKGFKRSMNSSKNFKTSDGPQTECQLGPNLAK